MNRRNFLSSLVGGVAVGAAVRTWPFRVFSFASEPTIIPAVNSVFVNDEIFLINGLGACVRISDGSDSGEYDLWTARGFFPEPKEKHEFRRLIRVTSVDQDKKEITLGPIADPIRSRIYDPDIKWGNLERRPYAST